MTDSPSYDLHDFSFDGYNLQISYRCLDGRIIQEGYEVCEDPDQADTTCVITRAPAPAAEDTFIVDLHEIGDPGNNKGNKILQGHSLQLSNFLKYSAVVLQKEATPEDVLYLVRRPGVDFL